MYSGQTTTYYVILRCNIPNTVLPWKFVDVSGNVFLNSCGVRCSFLNSYKVQCIKAIAFRVQQRRKLGLVVSLHSAGL
jgi:hypothetical protein